MPVNLCNVFYLLNSLLRLVTTSITQVSSLSSVCKRQPAWFSFTELSRTGDVAEIAVWHQLLGYQME